jgi:hypothetical protein
MYGLLLFADVENQKLIELGPAVCSSMLTRRFRWMLKCSEAHCQSEGVEEEGTGVD